MELELVEEFRAVTAHEPEELCRAFGREAVRLGEIEAPVEPDRIKGQVLEEHRPAFGDCVVAEHALLGRERRRRVCEVLRVTGLVEERVPVVRSALRLDDEHNAAGNLDRRAERAWILVRPFLEVELDVPLRVEVDAELAERGLEGREHRRRREGGVPTGAAERAADIPALDLCKPEPEPRTEEAVAGLLPQALRVAEERPALRGEVVERAVELAVEIGVARRAESCRLVVDDIGFMEVKAVEVLFGEVRAELRQLLALAAVLLVHQARPQHSERDLVAVERCAQRRLEFCDSLLLGRDETGEVALARELPELAAPADSGDRSAERESGVELRQAGMALVDRRDVVGVLLSGEMEVLLFVELPDELLGVGGEAVDFPFLKRLRHRRP